MACHRRALIVTGVAADSLVDEWNVRAVQDEIAAATIEGLTYFLRGRPPESPQKDAAICIFGRGSAAGGLGGAADPLRKKYSGRRNLRNLISDQDTWKRLKLRPPLMQ